MSLTNRFSIPRVVVAGLRGGAGKTTLSIGLCSALRARGLKVAAFKKGPDYIDAGWLAAASGGPCHNLDPYLIGEENILTSFLQNSAGKDIALIEGNRGLFDGMDIDGSQSTSRLARMLGAPVLLVVDCTKATRTIAALVKGVMDFEKGTVIGGVILNHTATARHEKTIRDSIEKYTGAQVLGAIPRLRSTELPERHMGLTPYFEHPDVIKAVQKAQELIERHVDIGGVLRIAQAAKKIKAGAMPSIIRHKLKCQLTIGVIRDSAFQFYYPENISMLKDAGAQVVEFSALKERRLPDIDCLYIGGGFPETNAITLTENRSFRISLKHAISGGLPLYAECGGLMYLGYDLMHESKKHKMAGVLPVRFIMHHKPRAHGYTTIEVYAGNPFFKKGLILKGHEFHYSEAVIVDSNTRLSFKMLRGVGISGFKDGICQNNVLATYTHIHALGTPQWVDGMVNAALRYKKTKGRAV